MRLTTLRIRRFTAAAATAVVLSALVFSTGCASHAQEGAAWGTGLGAIGGAIIGHQSGHGLEGAAIGAGAGALGGYIVGNEQDKAEDRHYRRGNYDY
jgi:uncharacterized protein YcfJ